MDSSARNVQNGPLCFLKGKYLDNDAGLHNAVGSASDCKIKVRKFESQLSHIHVTSADIGREIFSTVVLAPSAD